MLRIIDSFDRADEQPISSYWSTPFRDDYEGYEVWGTVSAYTGMKVGIRLIDGVYDYWYETQPSWFQRVILRRKPLWVKCDPESQLAQAIKAMFIIAPTVDNFGGESE